MRIIESVTIRYFRSVYTVNLSQCGDLTVITGKNDVGKSNILKALNLFFCNQSDYLRNFNFAEDYSIKRKEEVKKDTIRGQQFISITVRFLRGDRMPNSLPPSFSVTKRWDMHSNDCKMTTDVQSRMITYANKQGIKYSEKITSTSLSVFLNRIKFIYVPAIKDERVFNEILNVLQQSLFDSKNRHILDAPIGEANKAVQGIIGDLQKDFENATGIANFVELPTTLNYTNGLLQVNTQTQGGTVTIDKRGDGIRTHYIPKILHYVATHSKYNYIWGFEEPENSYEYRRCIQVAEEFDRQYSDISQIFITSHSPAFFGNESDKKVIVRVGNDDGKTVIINDEKSLADELGYIELYKGFIEQVKSLQTSIAQKEKEIQEIQAALQKLKAPLVLTEGKTDAALLKLAIKKLALNGYGDWEIKPILVGTTANNEVLLKYLLELRDNMHPSMPVIGMFDRDAKIAVRIDGHDTDIRDEEFVRIANNIYAFAIPVPHNRPETDQISIEHYFTDDEIKTELDGKRLFLGNEFYVTGVHKENCALYYKAGTNVAGKIKVIEHESNKFITNADGTGDYSISKARFVESIEQGKPGFVDLSFAEFQKIFDIFLKIDADSKASNAPQSSANASVAAISM